MAVMNLVQAINNALDIKLAEDKDILIFGEDAGLEGGVQLLSFPMPMPCRREAGRSDNVQRLVIDRRITQGTRGNIGRRWCERIWTVLTTCTQQSRSAFDVPYDSLDAHLKKQAPPTLLLHSP